MKKKKKTHKFSDSFFLENVGKFGNFGVFYFQIKDMALKALGLYKNCKPCSDHRMITRNGTVLIRMLARSPQGSNVGTGELEAQTGRDSGGKKWRRD